MGLGCLGSLLFLPLRYARTSALLLLVLVGPTLLRQNSAPMPLRFLMWRFELPGAAALALATGTGIALGFGLAWVTRPPRADETDAP